MSAADIRTAIAAAGLTPPERIIPDGKIHRFSTNGTRSKRPGWYAMYEGEHRIGVFGCWRLGIQEKWSERSTSSWTEKERQTFRNILKQAEAERTAGYARGIEVARRRWEAAQPAGDHPYLTRKQVQVHGIRQIGTRLVIPVRDADGEIQSLQLIGRDGEKRFQTGAPAAGGYFLIGEIKDRLIVAEGYATAASIHEATGLPVAVAFSASGLRTVCENFRERWPRVQITVAGDHDAPGRKAAEATGFPAVFPPGPGDFNDLATTKGPEAVRMAFEQRPASGFPLIDATTIKPRSFDWVIEGVAEGDTLSALVGAPKGGKSFFAIHQACCIATGSPFFGRPVRQGPVVYVAGEGQQGITRRLAAWQQHHGIEIPPGMLFISARAASLTEPDTWEAVSGAVRDVQPVWITVDTLARNFGPADENNTADMNRFVQALDMLREVNGAHVQTVHHTPRDAPGRARGSVALDGAMDAVYVLRRNGEQIEVDAPLLKDIPPPGPMLYTLETVQLPEIDGEAASSAVLVPATWPAPAERQRLSKSLRLALDTVLPAATFDDDGTASADIEDWRTRFYSRHAGDTADTKRKAFTRARQELMNLGVLQEIDGRQVLQPAGNALVLQHIQAGRIIEAGQSGTFCVRQPGDLA
ncbi:MAG: AAA family ATPase [Chromatiales bacterium]|nr:AAA family ATPase [Chromatiales bacterium]